MNINSPPTLYQFNADFENWFKENPNGGLFKFYKWTFKVEKK